MSSGEIVNNETEHRFELVEEGATAYASYEVHEGIVTFTHTIVPEEIEGRGVGSRLVRHALDAAREAGYKVVPQCYFVRGYIDRHPEYRGLLAER